ncbi:MAG: hypothetical protein A2066_17510 [Bacteroidetes bacterium GWB2_41_8]|nr:MAG: hypothetical protein A2066_17510 [Bacteroidetes bacterium GWB2_41_8]
MKDVLFLAGYIKLATKTAGTGEGMPIYKQNKLNNLMKNSIQMRSNCQTGTNQKEKCNRMPIVSGFIQLGCI